MSGKVVVITGAGSGIGQLAGRQALAGGWRVAALDVNASGLAALGESPRLLKLPVDITDFAAVQAVVNDIESKWGAIDRVVNAAGIMPLGPVLSQPRDVIHKIMAINYGGLVNIAHATLPKMIERRSGEFVSFSSIAGHWPVIKMGAYNASKHAVAALSEVLFHENRGSGVNFVCVCPPTVATPLLKQAQDTVWPKLMNVFPPITSEAVLAAMERSLKKCQFWCFPGPFTRMSWRARRWLPGFMWWFDHWVEKQ